MRDRLAGIPDPEKPKIETQLKTASLRSSLSTLVSPEIPPLPAEAPETVPRVLFIDDEQVNIDSASAIWSSTKLRNHAKLDTFLYRPDQDFRLLSLLVQSLDDRDPFTAIYVDLNLQGAGMDAGLGLIERLRSQEPRLRYVAFVAVTAFPDYKVERKARERGAIRFLLKTETNQGQSMLGGFVHRMVTEANETLEQCEDQMWADASAMLACELRGQPWESACKTVLQFIQQNLVADALFAYRDNEPGVLTLIHAEDSFALAPPGGLRLIEVPFIRDFLTRTDLPESLIIESLSALQIGMALPRASVGKLLGMRALLVRISLGVASRGLLTIYRHARAHKFRPRDAQGLQQIAIRLGTAIMAEETAGRLRARQSEIITILRKFDQAETSRDVLGILQDTLFKEIGNSAAGGMADLKSSLRKIEPGKNMTARALAAHGFPIARAAPKICLEDLETSSVARAVWNGTSEYVPNIAMPEQQGRHVLVADGIRTTLTIPLMASGLCLGVATLESRQPNAFSESDRDFASLLCATAAETVLRLRTLGFLDGMVALVQGLTISGRDSTDDYIRSVVKLLFDFTRCSKILWVLPPPNHNEAWVIDKVFLPNGIILDKAETEKAGDYIKKNWDRSYLNHVLTQIGKASWSDDPKTLIEHYENFALRGTNDKARAQAVIIVRKDEDQPVALVSLLFQHRHAVSERQMPLLDRLGSVLASLLTQGHQFQHLFGLASVQEQEARLGQIFGQFRHSLASRLAKLRALLDDGAHGALSGEAVLQEALPVLTDLESDISRNRGLVKLPEMRRIDLGELWSGIVRQLNGVAQRFGGAFLPDQLCGEMVTSDPVILETILFNLADNALRHGGRGVEVSAQAKRVGQKVQVKVTNTGQGIGPGMRASLFQPGKTTNAASTGMGLYLSAGRAKDLGGSLELESTDPQGTAFRLTLPEPTT